MRITCANHPGPVEVKHASVEAIRQCHLNPTAATGCPWLYQAGRDEDGGLITAECGGLTWATDRGWTCENGHEHVTAEIRHREGWDYASDAGEAQLMRKYGLDAVAMDGTGI